MGALGELDASAAFAAAAGLDAAGAAGAAGVGSGFAGAGALGVCSNGIRGFASGLEDADAAADPDSDADAVFASADTLTPAFFAFNPFTTSFNEISPSDRV